MQHNEDKLIQQYLKITSTCISLKKNTKMKRKSVISVFKIWYISQFSKCKWAKGISFHITTSQYPKTHYGGRL